MQSVLQILSFLLDIQKLKVFCMLTVSQSQNVGKCRAAGLSKLKSKCQSENKQKDISAYFRNSFAFHKRYLSSVLSSVLCYEYQFSYFAAALCSA